MLELSAKQLNFLEKNFVVYDPLDGSCQQDFRNLLGSKVVFIGQLSDSPLFTKIQNKFIENFTTHQDCILIEGIPLAKPIANGDLHAWPALPKNITVMGADLRVENQSLEKLKTYKKSAHLLINLQLKSLEDLRIILRNLGQFLSDKMLKENGSIIDQTFIIGHENVTQLKKYSDQLLDLGEKLLSERKNVEKIKPEKNKEISAASFTFYLTETVVNAAKHFKKVYPVLEMKHLRDKGKMLETLKKAKISYTILFPTQAKLSEAKQEEKLFSGKAPVLDLTLNFKEGDQIKLLTLTLPTLFASFCHPSIQNILIRNEKKSDEPFWIDRDFLKRNNGKITVNPNVPIRFFPVQEAEDIVDKNNFEEVLSILKPLKLFGQREFSIINKGNVEVKIKSDDGFRSYLQIKSPAPIHLEIAMEIHTTVEFIIAQMQREYLLNFNIEPNVSLFLLNFKTKKIHSFLKDENSLFKALKKRSPKGLSLKLRGYFSLTPAQIGSDTVNAICIHSKQGFKFLLVPN